MSARTACIVMIALVASAMVTPHDVAASSMRLIVTPAQGHAGDPIFLSGSGFAPRGRAPIFLRCGSQRPTHVATAAANSLGRFAGFQIRLSARNRTGKCGFSAASGAASATRTRESVYLVVPPQRSLARCTVQICLRIQAFLVRLRNGARGSIVISGWPGATIHVTVAKTEFGAKSRVLRLNWRGVSSMSTAIAPGLIKGLQARVFVHARLGRVTGTGKARFHVMFGNR